MCIGNPVSVPSPMAYSLEKQRVAMIINHQDTGINRGEWEYDLFFCLEKTLFICQK